MFPGGASITEFPIGTGPAGGSSITPAAPFAPPQFIPAPQRKSDQGGYALIPNLLLTTLAVVAATPRVPVIQDAPKKPQVQAFQPPNLLTSTLGTQAVPIPIGHQQIDSAPQDRSIPSAYQIEQNQLLFSLPLPIGRDQTDSAPPSIQIGAAQQTQARVLLEQVVQELPVGHQQVESAPQTPRVLLWDRGSNTLYLSGPMPVGQTHVDSAPVRATDVAAQQTQSRALLDQAEQPIPVGQQRTETQVQTPQVYLFTPEQILPPVVISEALPPGRQSTDSSPPTPRIGDIRFARGVDPGPPVGNEIPVGKQETDSAPVRRTAVDSFRAPVIVPPVVPAQEIPIGTQSTDSAPYTIFRPLIDLPQNLMAGPLGLQPIASSQSEFMQRIRPSQVFLWLPPNVTINLPVSAQAIPVGEQRIDSQVVKPAVVVFTPPQIVPPVLEALPVGRQQTESAPIPAPGVQSFTAPVIVPPALEPLPIGRQQVESAPIPAPPVQSFTAPVIIPPISGPLPIGTQRSESAPTWAVPIGMSVGWTIPPDLLPPGLVVQPEPDVTGGWPIYRGRVPKVRRVDVTETVAQIRETLEKAQVRIAERREARRLEKRARYVTEQIRQILDEQDRLKLGIEDLRIQLELAGMEEEEILLILALAG